VPVQNQSLGASIAVALLFMPLRAIKGGYAESTSSDRLTSISLFHRLDDLLQLSNPKRKRQQERPQPSKLSGSVAERPVLSDRAVCRKLIVNKCAVLHRRFLIVRGQLTATRGSDWQVHVEETSTTETTSSFPDPEQVHVTQYSESDITGPDTTSLCSICVVRWQMVLTGSSPGAGQYYYPQHSQQNHHARHLPETSRRKQWPSRLQ
jgi:hypothetical protein